MIREVELRFVLIALPFFIYGLYLFLMRWRPGHVPPKTPWTILFIIGLSLFAVSFLFWRFSEPADTSGVYVAPHLENGKVVPGHVEDKK